MMLMMLMLMLMLMIVGQPINLRMSHSSLIHVDESFVLLYRQLYYRHIHARLLPSVTERLQAFQNYIDLFRFFAGRFDPFLSHHDSLAFTNLIQYRTASLDRFEQRTASIRASDRLVMGYY